MSPRKKATPEEQEKATKPSTARKPGTASKPNTPAKPAKPAKKGLSAEERYMRMQQTAYFLAERDGFQRDPIEYWLAAESKFDAEN